jgi:putative membrane protein
MANRNDHLANERTFLAWIRTSLGIMAFGFVIVKFALLIKQISFVIKEATPPPRHGYSYVMGISLVAFGAVIAILAFIKYLATEKQIDQEKYRPSFLLSAILAAAVLLIGIFMVIYLIQSTR